MIFLALLLILWIVYTAILTFLFRSWKSALVNIKLQKTDISNPFSGISLIIVARNEENNIEKLFESISLQLLHRDLFEVLFINDYSTDKTVEAAERARQKYSLDNLQVISLSQIGDDAVLGKKAGLNYGINLAKYPIIAISDADCYLPTQWLTKVRDSFSHADIRAVCAPVLILKSINSIGRLQELDFAITSLVNAGAAAGKFFFLGNAANFAFEKQFYYDAGGYTSDRKASGDDVLLLQKMAEINPNSIYYNPVKDSAVYTHQESTGTQFYNQRLRWASKNNTYKNPKLNLTQFTVYLTNFFQLFLTLWLLLFPFIYVPLAVPAMLLVKISVDYFIAENALKYYHKKSTGILEFIQLNYHYAFYISFVATKSFFVKKYAWKDRRVT